MTDATKAIALSLLCTDLGFMPANLTEELKEFLEAQLASAEERLKNAGINLSENLADTDLLVSYAAWLYRGRMQQLAMPVQLRWMLRNRQAHSLLKEATE